MAGERERIDALLEDIIANAEAIREELDSVLLVPKPDVSTETVHVAVGESVQAAYDSLLDTGGVILLAPGLHQGDLKLVERPVDAKEIVFTTDSENLPGPNTRITPEYADALAIIQGVKTSTNPIRIQNKSRHTAFVNIGVGPPVTKSYTTIEMGGDEHSMLTPADRPDSFVFDRVYIYGDPTLGAHRGIALHASNVTVKGCYIKDIIEKGRDSQALSSWNGGQNIVIDNCWLEAGAENIQIGGADSASPEMITQDVRITNSHFIKQYNDAWKAASIKNLFEIKSVKRLVMDRCILEQNWARDWPTGVAFILKSCNGTSGETWATCEDVTMSNLVVRKVGSVFAIVGKNDSNRVSDWMRRVKLVNILAYDIDVNEWQGTGRGCPVANGCEDALVIDHVTMHSNSHSWMDFRVNSGILKSPGMLKWTNSMLCESSYGYFSEPSGVGFAAVAKDWNGTTLEGNVWKIGSRTQGTMPPGNLRLAPAAWEASIGPDHLVIPGSEASTVPTTDGKLPGADGSMLPAA
jgi:hypothetical protein